MLNRLGAFKIHYVFYPVCPGSGQYVLGTPYFDKMTLHLPKGKTLTIIADNQQADNCYVGTMTIDGQAYDKNYLEHETLMQGGVINYQLQAKPNQQRGIAESAVPYSFSKTLKR